MKILHVTPYYPPHIGGVEAVAKGLSEAMALRNHKITVITSAMPKKEPIKPAKGVTVKRLSAIEFGHIPFAPALLFAVLRELKKADIIHFHAGIAYYPEMCLLASKIMGKPSIITFHCDTFPSGKLGFFLPVYKKLFLKKVLQSTGKVVCLTKDHAEIVQKEYGVNKKNIEIIVNGVDDLFFEIKPREIKKEKTIRLIFIGRLVKQKNVSRLIETVSILSKKYPVSLQIAGTGEEREMLEKKVWDKKLQDKITFIGGKKMHEYEHLFKETDIFVSSSDYEGVPMVLMEAMASGVPAAATNVRGVKEFAKGLVELAEPNPEGLAKAIEKLFCSPSLRKRLSKKARKAMRGFGWAKVAEKYEKTYLETMG